MKNILIIIAIAIILLACNSKSQNETASENKVMNNKEDYSLIGKKGTITFPEMKASVSYISDDMLHWKTTDKKGVVAEGDEKISYKTLSENLHFLNWIEKDGFTVSQIIDTKNKTVTAFWSFSDEKSQRGKRASDFVNGTFEFEK